MQMLRKSLSAIVAVSLLTLTPLGAESDELHWDDGYRIFQDHSPNFVHVEIISINTRSNKALWFASASDRIEIEARVVKVVRSKDNLRTGMIIPIIYNRKAAAGGTFAETPGIPEQGSIVPAFIKLKGDHFIPAARHHTFEPLAKEQLEQLDHKDVELNEAQIAALKVPENLNDPIRTSTNAELPLENPPLKAQVTEPQTREVQPELPLVKNSTPGVITPVIPEASRLKTPELLETDTSVAVASEIDTPSIQVEAPPAEVTIPAVAPEIQEKPTIDTEFVPVKPKRRTVIVVPPSELRSRRQQSIQEVPIQAEPQLEPQAEPIPLTAETIPPQSIPEPPTITAPEPVETVAAELAPATSLDTQAVPDHVELEPLQEEVIEPAYVQVPPDIAPRPIETIEEIIPTPEPISSTPATAPQVEPITITDFSPQPPAATEPFVSPQSITETDRFNMKSYADIYVSLQQADNAGGKKDYTESKAVYEKALKDLENLKKSHPDFQPFMVEYRIRDTKRKLEQLILAAPEP